MSDRCIQNLTFLFFLSCSLLSAQQQLDRTITHDGNSREYTVYIPSSYETSTAVPLLFNFHGGSGDIASQIFTSDMRPIADTANFILVYPQAWPDPGDGGSTNWTHKQPTAHDDIFFVEAMIDELSAEYSIDQKRVYACGYSNGGEFCFDLVCRLGNRVAGIGVVARSMFIDTYDTCMPSHPTPVITIHGTEDDYDGIVWGGVTYYLPLLAINAYWSEYNNTSADPIITQRADLDILDGSTVEQHDWEEGDGCASVRHLKVENGGHDWPGTFGNMDIDASREIWNFLSLYNSDGLIACNPNTNEDLYSAVISIYPNPASSFIKVVMEDEESKAYEIFTSKGELVLSGTIRPADNSISVAQLEEQIYFLKIGNKLIRFYKIME